MSASPALVMNIFEPLRMYLPPLLFALVCIVLASEPELGSVRPKEATRFPEIISGRNLLFSSLPANLKVPSATVLWIAALIAIPASAAPASSIATLYIPKGSPRPPYSSGYGIWQMPCSKSAFL